MKKFFMSESRAARERQRRLQRRAKARPIALQRVASRAMQHQRCCGRALRNASNKRVAAASKKVCNISDEAFNE
jgi:hypothetical protein